MVAVLDLAIDTLMDAGLPSRPISALPRAARELIETEFPEADVARGATARHCANLLLDMASRIRDARDEDMRKASRLTKERRIKRLMMRLPAGTILRHLANPRVLMIVTDQRYRRTKRSFEVRTESATSQAEYTQNVWNALYFLDKFDLSSLPRSLASGHEIMRGLTLAQELAETFPKLVRRRAPR